MNPNGNTSQLFNEDHTIDLNKLIIFYELSKTMFGLSDKDIAQNLGISKRLMLSIIESKSKITVKTGAKIKKYFGTQIIK